MTNKSKEDMTDEQAIEVIKAYRDKLTNSASNQLDGDIEALEMAIQALEKENIYDDKEHYVTISKALYDKLNIDYEQALSQEPCDDAISREAVLEAVSEGCQEWRGIYGRCEELINALPSVTQQTGEWKQQKTDNTDWWECSECGAVIYSEHEYDMNEYHRFCGRCGAKMKSEEQTE